MSDRKTIYLAGPLFNPTERDYLERISGVLRPNFDVYIPHFHGFLLTDLLASGMNYGEARCEIFAADTTAVKSCDFFFIVLNGRSVDEGAAFELGVAWSLGKTCYGIKEDFRQLTNVGDNPMIESSLTRVFRSLEELHSWATPRQYSRVASSERAG